MVLSLSGRGGGEKPSPRQQRERACVVWLLQTKREWASLGSVVVRVWKRRPFLLSRPDRRRWRFTLRMAGVSAWWWRRICVASTCATCSPSSWTWPGRRRGRSSRGLPTSGLVSPCCLFFCLVPPRKWIRLVSSERTVSLPTTGRSGLVQTWFSARGFNLAMVWLPRMVYGLIAARGMKCCRSKLLVHFHVAKVCSPVMWTARSQSFSWRNFFFLLHERGSVCVCVSVCVCYIIFCSRLLTLGQTFVHRKWNKN